ncbi:hypothetical protein APR41_17845 [Salegentibacter salinarum]|uniref:Anti-sigma factor n=1 Tax=Salegentibacter salinarum TaxID=447422 RepID=A0A2N0TVH0_9FLAO|nr:FecR domain-containing protein [Salegentibacter salinarum]PKD18658.1 hypothetical protein APR41_17845 [Salegentibacter salinarum]SKB99071.1 FecR family protein [Salegentibacter salinarum]
MRKEDLIQFIKGSGNKRFQQSVIDWVKTSPENRRYYNRVKADYVSKFQVDHHIDIDKEFDRFLVRKQQGHNQRIFFKVASVIVLALLAGGGWFLTKADLSSTTPLAVYEAQPSLMEEITLPDGSKVSLNSGSIIEIADDFNKSNREVYLEGEAFFEVERDEARPFVVSTSSDLKVRVLGTSFNVKSYKTDQTIETTLVSGKVELLQNNRKKSGIALFPNQKATFDKVEDRINIEKVSTFNITSWKDGVLIFDNEPIQNVLNSLERWYDVEIKIKDSVISTYTFSGKVKRKTDIEEVLELLEASSPIKYHLNEKQKTFILSKNN